MNAPSTAAAVPPIWTTGSTLVFKTGTWRSSLARHVVAPSPCHRACPMNGEIAEWIGLARRRDWRAAWEVLVRHNPFPAITGRVCHHPCESACNREALDEAISICRLERFVGDHAIAEGWQYAPPAQERQGHVAVVGGGPAGLSAAYQLRRQGWRVSLVEASAALGGLMRHGIPGYRLPRSVLDAEVERIVALGVELHLGAPLADAQAFAALRARHDAVFVATGAARSRTLPQLAQLGTDMPWVMQGADYLAAANAGTPPALGEMVVVIGGGSAAFDAARSARRAGHEVTILSLEAREQLPAQREEVDEALEEGVALVDGVMLRHAAPLADGGLRLQCVHVRFVPGAERGRFDLEVQEGSAFTFGADALLVSIGQDPDLAPFGDALAARGALIATEGHGRTSHGGVWAGGDLTSMDRFVSAAIGMGKRAALAIHAELLSARGEPPQPERASEPVVSAKAIATWYHAPAARAAASRQPPEARDGDIEVQLGLTDEQVAAESARCFSCGLCIDCDNCVAVCPDMAVRRLEGDVATGTPHYEVLADYCKGCGLCVRECPTGSMAMQEESR